MGREETESPDIPETSNQFLPERRPQRVAGVLDQEKVVSPGDIANDIHIARIAQGMRNNQGAGAGRNGRFDKVWIDIVGAYLRINQNGD